MSKDYEHLSLTLATNARVIILDGGKSCAFFDCASGDTLFVKFDSAVAERSISQCGSESKIENIFIKFCEKPDAEKVNMLTRYGLLK